MHPMTCLFWPDPLLTASQLYPHNPIIFQKQHLWAPLWKDIQIASIYSYNFLRTLSQFYNFLKSILFLIIINKIFFFGFEIACSSERERDVLYLNFVVAVPVITIALFCFLLEYIHHLSSILGVAFLFKNEALKLPLEGINCLRRLPKWPYVLTFCLCPIRKDWSLNLVART